MPIKLDDFYNKPAIELLILSDKDLVEAKRLSELLNRCLDALIKKQNKIYKLQSDKPSHASIGNI